jgi:hypothetical protein
MDEAQVVDVKRFPSKDLVINIECAALATGGRVRTIREKTGATKVAERVPEFDLENTHYTLPNGGREIVFT